MQTFIGAVFSLLLFGLMQLLIAKACARTKAIARWRAPLVAISVVWWLLPLIKKLFLDDIFPPADGIVHEEMARYVAGCLLDGDWSSAFQLFGAGNDGYRFLLGVFYALTAAPEVTTYALHGTLAFWAVLSLLETLCVYSRCERLEFWHLLLLLLTPSIAFWTTANLKEGAMLWGICMILRLGLTAVDDRKRQNIIVPLVGLAVAGFLRPHIVIAYLGGLSAGSALRHRRFGLATVTVLAAGGALLVLNVAAPNIVERFADDGIGMTLNERYLERNHLGGSAMQGGAAAKPIPFLTGLTLLFLRPYPTEILDVAGAFASAEIWLISLTGIGCWIRLRNRRRLATSAYVVSNLVTIVLLSFFFSYMYNMGLMVRQRVMALPAIFALTITPGLAAQRSTGAARRSRRGTSRTSTPRTARPTSTGTNTADSYRSPRRSTTRRVVRDASTFT
jgi:hypothetical protein